MIFFLFSPCFSTGQKYLYCRDPERVSYYFVLVFKENTFFVVLQRVTNKRASLYFLLSLGLYLKF